ncbi:hypothetical protein TSMEX_002601 [Taenia solium]|eukprot:TsM_000550200 transcript=TsM_000550200 gene=TsM_000550200
MTTPATGLTRSRSSLTIQYEIKSSSTLARTRRKGKSRSSTLNEALGNRAVRSSTNRKTQKLQPQKKKSSKKSRKQPEPLRSFDGIAGNRKFEGQTRNGLLNASRSPSVPESKLKRESKTRGERPEDPYELSADENDAPTAAFCSPSASPAVRASVEKKRKFFPNRRENPTKRTALLGFELLRQKLTAKSRGCRRPLLAANRIFSSRAAPMSESERARIAATTIWLPVPNQQCASTPNGQRPQRLQPPLLSLPPPDEKSEILTGNPAVRLSSLSVLDSPLDSRTVESSNTPLESTAVIPREGSTHDALPLADISNISPRPQPLSSDRVGDKIHKETRRISFAQRLSPIPKRPSGSRGSSNLSTSGSKVHPHRHSCNEDASNYEEWLEQFNSQLKPYEEFDLTIG